MSTYSVCSYILCQPISLLVICWGGERSGKVPHNIKNLFPSKGHEGGSIKNDQGGEGWGRGSILNCHGGVGVQKDLKCHGVGGLDMYSTENYLKLNVMGRGGYQKSNVGGVFGKNFQPTPHCHFKWNRPDTQLVVLSIKCADN